MREMIRPSYAYDGSTTLGGLFRQFMEANGLDLDAAKIAIGEGSSGLTEWLEDRTTVGLMTSRRSSIEKATGISIDRWMVAVAKQNVLRARPELADVVRYDRLVDRDEVVLEIMDAQKRYGGQSAPIALQMGVDPALLNRWVNISNQRPTGTDLEAAIVALAVGLIPDATRDDVVFIVYCRRIFGADPTVVFPENGIKDFTSAIAALWKGYGTDSPVVLANKSGLKRHAAQDFKAYKPNPNAKTTERTVLEVIRALVTVYRSDLKKLYPPAMAEFEKNGKVDRPLLSLLEVNLPTRAAAPKRKVETKPPTAPVPEPKPTEAAPESASRVEPEQAPVHKPAPAPPIPAPDPVAPVTPAPSAEKPARDLTELLARVLHFGAHQAQAMVDARQEPSASPVPSTDVFGLTVGETIEGVAHCLGDGLRPHDGEMLSSAAVEQIKAFLHGIRLVLVDAAGLPAGERLKLVRAIAPEFDELAIAVSGLGYPHIVGSLDMIRGTREVMQTVRNGGVSDE